ncbi:hypothetical protein QA584_23610 [Anaerocolumna sp. AGMB13025]|uniref:transglutaminase domain-containing protein n=1 Tax=Anaerocolumna sp. AGMB13025 TaxID=3039116 RepID=UPI00241CAC95|nr:transglutaminase domain-containing protein [Anaerocolumna sp. AGMB13025]WFR56571.1 hypothetical protein QA584_23610 [Anaerocolumna sp. AGMB13025]
MKNKLISIILCTSLLLSGCGLSTIEKQTLNDNTSNTATSDTLTTDKGPTDTTVMSLKSKYQESDDLVMTPMYNVEQNTEFVFHFNSDVDPVKAITVHTDRKCEKESTVLQYNDGYKTTKGVDVVVKPKSSVLNIDSRLNNTSEEDIWGYAPIYYLSVNYDFNSTEVKKLNTPLIIPFTVYNEVSTPNIGYQLNTDGTFTLKWSEIVGADSYRVYKASVIMQSETSSALSAAERGYVGEHLDLLTETTDTSFRDINLDGNDNCSFIDGYVSSENWMDYDNYYITAVKDGKESFFSTEISPWKFYSQMPNTIKGSIDTENGLPNTVAVRMKDESILQYPISYKKIDSKYEKLEDGYDKATYEYQVENTLLAGTIDYHSDKHEYPEEIDNSTNTKYSGNPVKNEINVIPDNSIPTLAASTYENVNIDLSKTVDYPLESKLLFDEEALYTRADMEVCRIIYCGLYMEGYTPEDIKTYISSYDVTPMDLTTTLTDEPGASQTVSDTDNTIPSEITSANLVDEQIKSTQNEVAEGNQTKVPTTEYAVFADSSEEEYLALQMINGEEHIPLQAFPSLQNGETLIDTLNKVYYQNPYILGLKSYSYNIITKTLNIEYSYDTAKIKSMQKEILAKSNQIVKEHIDTKDSEEAIILDIWDYLEDNTAYDDAALDAAEKSGFSDVSGFEDSFNTYGILCKNRGVCQSYAYAFKLLCYEAGVDSVVLTGYLDRTLPHAWNAVKLEEEWYWIDSTNNVNTSGIPFMLYQTSSDYAEKIDYVLDSGFDLDSNLDFVKNDDNKHDYYYANNLYAENEAEAVSILYNQFLNTEDNVAAIKCSLDDYETIIKKVVKKLYSENKLTDTDLDKISYGQFYGYIIIIKDSSKQ